MVVTVVDLTSKARSDPCEVSSAPVMNSESHRLISNCCHGLNARAAHGVSGVWIAKMTRIIAPKLREKLLCVLKLRLGHDAAGNEESYEYGGIGENVECHKDVVNGLAL
jgi:hypothetical protein